MVIHEDFANITVKITKTNFKNVPKLRKCLMSQDFGTLPEIS